MTTTIISKSRRKKAVGFDAQSEVRYIDTPLQKSNTRPRRSCLKMTTKLYQQYDGTQVTDSMLREASQLFNENYGIWGKESGSKIGTRVKMSKDRLRAQLLPSNVPCSYVRVTVDGDLAGNVFACRWKYNGIPVCWVTQLVVHRDYRERGLAAGLLNELRQEDEDIYGVVSSHPAACLATAKAFGRTIYEVQLSFIRDHAEAIMGCSPISYIKNAKLRGSLFNSEDTSGVVSSVDTGFFVDHEEPLEALVWVRENINWPLGELIDGHEFLLILQVRRRARSTSRHRISSVGKT